MAGLRRAAFGEGDAELPGASAAAAGEHGGGAGRHVGGPPEGAPDHRPLQRGHRQDRCAGESPRTRPHFMPLILAGTFCTLDICISRLEDVGTADIRGTVERIRSQRAYSIQMPDQYVFCHLALIEYAMMKGYLQSADLAGFDQGAEDDSE